MEAVPISYDPTPYYIVAVFTYLLFVIAIWKLFSKAGYPGWGAIIPIYNAYILVKIAGFHGATVLLYLIPIVNFIFGIFVALGVGKAFGKGAGFSIVLLWLFAIIGYFVVGYGADKYVGPGGNPTPAVTA